VTQGTQHPSVRRRPRLALLVLPALLLRALIPMGFMPARETPFSVTICPDGFPTQLLVHAAHHHHQGRGDAGRGDHCLFGSTSGSGPLSESAPGGATLAALQLAGPPPATPAFSVRLVYLPEPRGPPAA
jgi:hypothetical protein